MKRSRFSETEIVYAVKQVEARVPVGEVARKYGSWNPNSGYFGSGPTSDLRDCRGS